MNSYFRLLKSIWSPLINCLRNNTQCKHSAAYNRLLRDLPKTQCSILSNGLTIATEERACSNICMGLFIDAGSRHEDEFENGITHFFEHIAFKGTSKRTKTDLENEISKAGAKFKCFTSRDHTAYLVECLAPETSRVADILFDCIFNNAFLDNEIEIQKNTVYHEMLEYEKSSINVLFDYLHSAAFQGTQLAQTIIGPSHNLYNFKSLTISKYLRKIFSSQKIVFAAVGGVRHDSMICIAEQHFKKTECCTPVSLGPERYTGSQIVYRDDSMNAAHIAIAVQGPSFKNNDRITMELASSILGGWETSQPGGLNHGIELAHIASGGNLCESYKTFRFYYQDVGLWGIQYISPRQEVDDMLLVIQKQWMRLCHLITDSELIIAKNEMKFKLLKTNLTTVGACYDIGLNILRTNCRPDIYERINDIDKISAEDLRKVCDYYIYDRCPVVVGVGSTETLLPYSRIRGYMYWLRV